MSILRTFMGSAYISAMLASSVAPIRNNTTLAAAINPHLLQSVATGMGISMPAPAATTIPVPLAVAIFSDTQLSDDAFSRLREYILATPREASIGPVAAKLLGLEANGQSVPIKQMSYTLADGKRYFNVATKPNSDDIILAIKRNEAMTILYLTNSKLVLRATLVLEPNNSYLITNEQAAAGFKALLEFWAEKAKTLPPSTLVNS